MLWLRSTGSTVFSQPSMFVILASRSTCRQDHRRAVHQHRATQYVYKFTVAAVDALIYAGHALPSASRR
jgi:uncharacterized PurR-regulated membrane protein YhhQ (DUF165 family)